MKLKEQTDKELNRMLRQIEFENHQSREEYRNLTNEILEHEKEIAKIRVLMVKETEKIENRQQEFNRIAQELRNRIK